MLRLKESCKCGKNSWIRIEMANPMTKGKRYACEYCGLKRTFVSSSILDLEDILADTSDGE